MNASPPNVLLAGVLLLTGIFYSATVRQGHTWGDDFALYIHHAENIVKGVNYSDTGYLYDPYLPDYGPRIYPPVFPIFLAPVYKLHGLDLTPMKEEEVVLFVLSLAAIFVFFRDQIPASYALALVTVLALNPYFWELKDYIGSDTLFLLFVYISVALIHYLDRPQPRPAWPYALLAGIALYLCCGTRSIGAVLIPSLLVYDVVRWKRITRFSVVAIAVCAAILVIQKMVIQSDSSQSYADQFHPTLTVVRTNVAEYIRDLRMLWVSPSVAPRHGFSRVLSFVLAGVVSLLALLGVSRRELRRPTILEVFAVFYLVLIFLWPANQGMRFLIPLLPLYIFYAFLGLRFAAQRWSHGRLSWFAVPLSVALAVAYIGAYRMENFAVISDGIGRPAFGELCDYIRRNTGPQDVFVFSKPRLLSLFTDRPASPYHEPANPDDLWTYWKSLGVRYVISSDLFDDDRTYLKPLLDRHQSDLRPAYSNADFQVWAMR
jgi:hypothetical protein